MSKKFKFCVDCKHYKLKEQGWWSTIATCMRPSGTISRVTGKNVPVNSSCAIERGESLRESCGPDAKFFRPKLTFIEKIVAKILRL